MGDEIQAIKAGLLEVADLVVVNKGDKPGALRTAAQLRAMLVPTVGRSGPSDRAAPKRPEVLVTTASTGEGVPELLATLDRHRATGHDGLTSEARRARAQAQIRGVLADRLGDRLRDPSLAPLADTLVDDVAEHRLDPYAAADRLLEAIAREDR
jgi:LAO/AO transport system kinase